MKKNKNKNKEEIRSLHATMVRVCICVCVVEAAAAASSALTDENAMACHAMAFNPRLFFISRNALILVLPKRHAPPHTTNTTTFFVFFHKLPKRRRRRIRLRIRICIVHKEEEEKEKTLPMEMKREKLLLHILPNFLFVEVPQLWESKLTLITTRMLVEDALFNKGY